MKKLAIITTHPVQYYAPVFKLLNQSISIKVFYTWGEKAMEKFDPGFGKKINWDIPLLDGYDYQWIKNISTDAGSHHFKGIINPDLINQIKTWQPDAMLVLGWSYHSHLKVIRYFKNKIPVYFRGDSTLLDVQTGMKAFLRSIFLKWVYSYIDHAFYTGTNNKAYFKKYGLRDKQLSFVPHAIDNDRFAADRGSEVLKLRKSLNIPADDLLILFAGKLEQKKSPQLLLRAFINLNMPHTHLLFVGSGALEATVRSEAQNNVNVHFLGFRNQSAMPVIYQACDVFCLPSRGPGETWGLAVNEALACGKTVLVSDKVGCAVDLVIPGLTGDIFEAGNLGDITEKLRLLITDRPRLKTLGINAKNRVSEWSFEKQVDAILNVMQGKHAV